MEMVTKHMEAQDQEQWAEELLANREQRRPALPVSEEEIRFLETLERREHMRSGSRVGPDRYLVERRQALREFLQQQENLDAGRRLARRVSQVDDERNPLHRDRVPPKDASTREIINYYKRTEPFSELNKYPDEYAKAYKYHQHMDGRVKDTIEEQEQEQIERALARRYQRDLDEVRRRMTPSIVTREPRVPVLQTPRSSSRPPPESQATTMTTPRPVRRDREEDPGTANSRNSEANETPRVPRRDRPPDTPRHDLDNDRPLVLANANNSNNINSNNLARVRIP